MGDDINLIRITGAKISAYIPASNQSFPKKNVKKSVAKKIIITVGIIPIIKRDNAVLIKMDLQLPFFKKSSCTLFLNTSRIELLIRDDGFNKILYTKKYNPAILGEKIIGNIKKAKLLEQTFIKLEGACI